MELFHISGNYPIPVTLIYMCCLLFVGVGGYREAGSVGFEERVEGLSGDLGDQSFCWSETYYGSVVIDQFGEDGVTKFFQRGAMAHPRACKRCPDGRRDQLYDSAWGLRQGVP